MAAAWAQMFSAIVMPFRRLFASRPLQTAPRAPRAKSGKSGDAAKRRLQLVLVQDRIGIAPDMLDALRADLVKAVSKRLGIDRDSIDFEISRSDGAVQLTGNISIGAARRS